MTWFWIAIIVLLMAISYCLGYVLALARVLEMIDEGKWKS